MIGVAPSHHPPRVPVGRSARGRADRDGTPRSICGRFWSSARTSKAAWSASSARGWPRAGRRSATSRKSPTSSQKRLAVAAGPQQKKIHLKLGIVDFFLGHIRTAVEHLTKAEGPLAAFFLGQAHVYLGQARAYADDDGDTTDHLEAAVKAFDKAEKTGYAAQQVQLQKAGVLRLQGHIGEAKTILAKLKDAAAHNAEYYYQEGGIAEAEGDPVRAAKFYSGPSNSNRATPAHCSASASSTTCRATTTRPSASTSGA